MKLLDFLAPRVPWIFCRGMALKCSLKAVFFFVRYWITSFLHPIRVRLFLRRYPRLVSTGPRILLVGGEDGPDKMGSYLPIYTVYVALREVFDVGILVVPSLKERHVERIVKYGPDLVLLSFDNGKFQALLEQRGIPFMGSDSRTCATCLDKIRAQEVARESGIQTASTRLVTKGDCIDEIAACVRYPAVVKPRFGGSSKGVSKVNSDREIPLALQKAFYWGDDVLVQDYIPGREYTCTVYGNDTPKTLTLNRKIMAFERAEMRERGEDVSRARFPVPAGDPYVERIHELSKSLYRTLNCRDMIRVDWKYDPAAELLYLLEINILPWMGRPGGNIEDCARFEGSSYEEFVRGLFHDALRRNVDVCGSRRLE